MTKAYKRKIEAWVNHWKARGYPDFLPDEAPETLEEIGRVPSYRLICMAIMKNDHTLELLGYSRPACRLYSDLKRSEIEGRSGRKEAMRPLQYRLPGAS